MSTYTQTVTETFNPGSHELTLTSVSSDVQIQCWGGTGGDGDGAQFGTGATGGHADATFALASETTLQITVGALGGGGSGGSVGGATAGSGGGRSAVRTGASLDDALVVAGGGGGGGAAADGDVHAASDGGAGGDTTGQAGADASTTAITATGGAGGTTSGGAGSGAGAAGATASNNGSAAGGGGGDGWDGAGGGGATDDKNMGDNHAAGAGGGGGSNYIADTHADYVSTTANQRGVDPSNGGGGLVEIQYDQEVYDISGTVTDSGGTAIQNATVYAVDSAAGEIITQTSTNSSGAYTITGVPSGETVHVAAQHDDGSTKYAGKSYPFIDGTSS